MRVAKQMAKQTKLARLSQYYLACLRNQEMDVSIPVDGQSSEDFIELNSSKLNPDIQNFLIETKRDKGCYEFYLGYPTNLRRKRSENKFLVEPIFLIPIELEKNSLKICYSKLGINFAPLKKYSNEKGNELMSKLSHLKQKLGIINGNNLIEKVVSFESEFLADLMEVLKKLKTEYPEWLWQEDINPNDIFYTNSLKDLSKEGIYNRAVCVRSEGKPYHKNLEFELQKLSQMNDAQYAQSILGKWINGYEEADEKKNSLLRILPMNSEQTQAVRTALTNNLTVITGPPGTGKSQVVTNILVNAVWHGEKVLFASKNHQAIEVIKDRVNNLSPHPFLVKVGSLEYLKDLQEHLNSLSSIETTPEDEKNYNFYKDKYSQVQNKLNQLESKEKEIADLRNKLEELSQDLEVTRKIFCIQKLRDIDYEFLSQKYELCASLVTKCFKDSYGPLASLLQKPFKKRWNESLLEEAEEIIVLTEDFLPKKVNLRKKKNCLREWEQFLEDINLLIEHVGKSHKYFSMLEKLKSKETLESMARQKLSLANDESKYASYLWENWLKLKAESLSDEDRRNISQYQSWCKLIGEDVDSSSKKKKYKETLSKSYHLFSAWGVTSLSVRSHFPLEENMFDVVVFDEASQSDIASALPLLFRAKKAVIIGDAQQLSHISNLDHQQDKSLLQEYGLLDDFIDWSFSSSSLFHLANGLAKRKNIISLKDHHRSHKDIINFSNQQFYDNKLRVVTSYERLNFPSDEQGVRWKNISGETLIPKDGSAENKIEAQAIVEELRKLVQSGYKGTIGVVTPFRAQANLINKLVNKDRLLDNSLKKNEFLVDTIHKFQGDEKDVIIFSTVVSKGCGEGPLFFVNESRNLFNVAITRAKSLLLAVGDTNYINGSDIIYLKRFTAYCQEIEQKREGYWY